MVNRDTDTQHLVARVAASLAGKPRLRAALAVARSRDKVRLDHLVRDDGAGTRRGVLVRHGGFHLALMFGGRPSVTWRAYDGASDGDPAEVAEGLFRYGVRDGAGIDAAGLRRVGSGPSSLPALSPDTVEAVEGIEDDDVVLDVSGRLSDALHRVALAGVRTRLLASLGGDGKALVAHLLRDGRDLDPGMAMAIHAATGVEGPDRVLQAVRAAPLLETLLWPTGPFQARSRELLGRIAEGRSPLHVVRDMLGLPEIASPVLLRSAANLPADGRLAADAVLALSRFHSDHPRHRGLDVVECSNVAAAVPVVRSPAVVRHLLDGSGRVGPAPEGLADAVASLGESLEAIGGHLPGGFLVARHARDAVAFPPSRRHASLVRIDRAWHASVGRHEAALSALRDEALSAGVAIPEGEFPHLARAGAVVGCVRAVPMLTRADYLGEGAAMGHCVGSYAGRAWAGRLVGLSLRDADGGRSTMTVEVGRDGALSPAEHRGAGNAVPPRAHAAAVDVLVRSLPADRDAMQALLRVREARSRESHEATLLPRGATAAHVRRHVHLHFANASHWLTPSEVAMGVDAWWETVVGRDARRRAA